MEETKPKEPENEQDVDSQQTSQNIIDFGSSLVQTNQGTVYILTIAGQTTAILR